MGNFDQNFTWYSSGTLVFSLKSEFFLKVVLKLNMLNIYEVIFNDWWLFQNHRFLSPCDRNRKSYLFSTEIENYSNRLVTCVYDSFHFEWPLSYYIQSQNLSVNVWHYSKSPTMLETHTGILTKNNEAKLVVDSQHGCNRRVEEKV